MMDAAARANTMCYIGRTTKPEKEYPDVGSVVCAAVDTPDLAKSAAKALAKWIRDGLTVEHVPVWWVRLHFGTTERYREGDVPPADDA